MAKGYRQGRLGEEIKRIVSDLLFRELKDPRLDYMISITDVEVTADGSFATLYLTVYEAAKAAREAGEEEADRIRGEVLEGMQRAKGVMKKEIGHQMKLRHVPELLFKMDRSMDYGAHIDSLIDRVVKKDPADAPDPEEAEDPEE